MTKEGDYPQTQSVEAYHGKTGAVELLCEVDVSGSQFTRLAEALGISRTTLTKRLNEGEKLGLLERVDLKGRGTSHAYTLTETGAKLRMHLNQSGATETHRQLKRLQQEFDGQSEQLQKWVSTNEEELAVTPEQNRYRRLLAKYGSSDRI
jgi:DNA-binding HxlR family transcriptional regulator